MKLGYVAGLCILVFATTANAATDDGATEKPRNFRIGPAVSMGAPSGFGGGLSMKFYRLIGVEARASYVPWMTVSDPIKLSRTSYEGVTRVYPTRDAFFLGVAGGYAQLRGAATDNVGAGTVYAQQVSARAGINYAYVRPELGWLWAFDNGMTLGIHGGAEIPVWHSQATATVTSSQGTQNATGKPGASGATTALAFVGTHALPAVTLFEVGFLL
jgi:hypothetical protein